MNLVWIGLVWNLAPPIGIEKSRRAVTFFFFFNGQTQAYNTQLYKILSTTEKENWAKAKSPRGWGTLE